MQRSLGLTLLTIDLSTGSNAASITVFHKKNNPMVTKQEIKEAYWLRSLPRSMIVQHADHFSIAIIIQIQSTLLLRMAE